MIGIICIILHAFEDFVDREKVAPVDNILRDSVRTVAAKLVALCAVLLRVGVMHNADSLKTIFRRTHIAARFAQACQTRWVIHDCHHLLSPDAQRSKRWAVARGG